ncbi:MAG: hypothetical protein ABI977_09320 [Acidobacteriota bacterium]
MPERQFLVSNPAPPDPTADTYILITETTNPATDATFNTVKTAMRNVTVSGMTLVIDKDTDANQLFTTFNEAKDIQSLTLAADRVVIRSPLTLHQTNLTIFARELAFEADGKITTTPVGWETNAAPSDGTNPGSDGNNGESGGSITLNFSMLTLPQNDTAIRFDLTGGTGQQPGAGASKDGANLATWDGNAFFKSDGSQSTISADSAPFNNGKPPSAPVLGAFYYFFPGGFDTIPEIQGSWGFGNGPDANGNGQAGSVGTATKPDQLLPSAIPSGRPGSGGNGGNLIAPDSILSLEKIDLTKNTDLNPGTTPPAVNTKVGAIGTPANFQFLAAVIDGNLGGDHQDFNINPLIGGGSITTDGSTVTLNYSYDTNPSLGSSANAHFQGQSSVPKPVNVLGAVASPGNSGQFTQVPASGTWIHPAQLKTVLHYTEDAFLSGDRQTTTQVLDTYLTALAAGNPPNADDVVFFQNTLTQMSSLQHRLDSNLDYFFNPAGWTPELSLQANLEIYQQEVSDAVETLFLAYWVENQTDKTKAAADAITKSIDTLEQQRKDAINTLNSAEKRFADLQVKQTDIESQITQVKTQLQALDTELRAEAQSDIDQLHALNFLMQGFSLLTSVIPYGQPELGSVGSFISKFGSIDPTQVPDLTQTGEFLTEKFGEFLKEKLNDKAKELKDGAEKTVTEDGGDKPDPSDAKAQAAQLNAIAGNLGTSLKGFSNALFDLGAPKDEVEAKLQELEAHDARFQALASTLQDLNDKKQQLAQQINLALQEISSATSTIINSLLATNELFQQRQATLSLLGHQALLFAREMGREAQRRLRKYQYYLIKSYEYRVLKPFQGVNYDLDDVFTQFKTLLASSTDGALTEQQIKDLVNVTYTANLQKIADQILADFESGVTSETAPLITISLEPDKLGQLNNPQSHQTIINFQNLQEISPRWQNVRISDISITDIEIDRSQMHAGETLIVDIQHSGNGTTRFNGQLLAFKTASLGTPDEPAAYTGKYWGASLNLADATATPQNFTPSNADTLLLESLLGNRDSEAAAKELLSYKPPAWADLSIAASIIGGGSQPVTITALTMEATLEFQPAAGSEVVLEVLEQKGRSPQIICHSTSTGNPNDENGQTDGPAPLFRIYQIGTPVHIEAPAQFGGVTIEGGKVVGGEVFKEWQDRAGTVLSQTPGFDLILDSNHVDSHGEVFLQCVYVPQKPSVREIGGRIAAAPRAPIARDNRVLANDHSVDSPTDNWP